jgi:hypothetical protein
VLDVRSSSSEQLVLGPSRFDEFLALLTLGFGICAIGMTFVYPLPGEDSILILLPLGGLVAVGLSVKLVFLPERWIFDRAAGALERRRPLREIERWQFSEIENVELSMVRISRDGDCTLCMTDGTRCRLFSGAYRRIRPVAQAITAYVQVPLLENWGY